MLIVRHLLVSKYLVISQKNPCEVFRHTFVDYVGYAAPAADVLITFLSSRNIPCLHLWEDCSY